MHQRFYLFQLLILVTTHAPNPALCAEPITPYERSDYSTSSSGSSAAPSTQSIRLFTVDDLFSFEDQGHSFGGAYAFSDDGAWLAFTRVRAQRTLPTSKWARTIQSNARGDIWVLPAGERQPINITSGAEDGSGWFSPKWSPDGTQLAMLSTRGDRLRLWIWDTVTRQLRPVTTGTAKFVGREQPYMWLDSRHIVYAEDLSTGSAEVDFGFQCRAHENPHATKSTASVLETGQGTSSAWPHWKLRLIDTRSATSSTIVDGIATQFWLPSPNGKLIAFSQEVSKGHWNDDRLRVKVGSFVRGSGEWRLRVVDISGSPISITGEIPTHILEDSLSWSTDGSKLAFFGFTDSDEARPLLFRWNSITKRSRAIVLNGLDASYESTSGASSRIHWTAADEVLIVARQRSIGADNGVEKYGRRDWWLIRRDGTIRALTKSMRTPPANLIPKGDGRTFLGIAEGEIWRFDTVRGSAQNITARFSPQVESIWSPPTWPSAWPARDQSRRNDSSALLFIARAQSLQSQLELYQIELSSGAIAKLNRPTRSSALEAYSRTAHRGVFSQRDHNGLAVWVTDTTDGESLLLYRTNEFVQNIKEGEVRSITYNGLDGQSLKAWLILPPNYVNGKLYPLVTWVYEGYIAEAVPPMNLVSVAHATRSLNLQLLAAQGYAILIPSMPRAPNAVTRNVLHSLQNGVMPAVNKIIDMGIADPERLGLLGHSNGGYSVYGLISQTHRFKAAVALAGISNLISAYGQFNPSLRSTEYAREDWRYAFIVEGFQPGLHNPPWGNWWSYIQNSPIFFVEYVKTPLMIIHGDDDFVPSSQGEEFFSALARQGKRATFVRYSGEGHSLENAHNIKDAWLRIIDWFDTYLKGQ